MPATLTPLRYPGGKTKYARLFADTVSKNNLDGCTFVEAFAGGAGAAIWLLLNKKVKAVILNDLDATIYSFWRCVKECPQKLIELIQGTPVCMAEWRRQKAIYDRKGTKDWLALGFSTFYLNRCNHSGILEARPIGGMQQKGKYNIRSRYNKTTSIAKIKAIAEHSSSIDVFNLDAVSFLNLLKRRYRERKCLIYFDPPYYQKGPELYLNHFAHEDHVDLRDHIVKCPFPWVLSYDNHEEVVRLYQGHDCGLYRNQVRHTVAGNAYADELIVSKLILPFGLERFCGNVARSTP